MVTRLAMALTSLVAAGPLAGPGSVAAQTVGGSYAPSGGNPGGSFAASYRLGNDNGMAICELRSDGSRHGW